MLGCSQLDAQRNRTVRLMRDSRLQKTLGIGIVHVILMLSHCGAGPQLGNQSFLFKIITVELGVHLLAVKNYQD